MITAPYNFVPLNKEVFYPSWSETVSHDIPFVDGESGEIDITITAETAIYIRNHYLDGDDFYEDKKGNKISKEFCHIQDCNGGKQYYIPGTSLKGMLKNIVEIMSFSKIKVDEKTLSKPISVRDMTEDKNTGQIFNHDMVATAKKCGFLVKEEEKYFIEDCGNVLTIRDTEIKMQMHNYTKDIDTAEEKYKQFGHVIEFPYEITQKDCNGRKMTIAVYNKNSNLQDILVMTGFIDNKKNEFIFKTNGRKTQLNKNIIEDFEKVYFLNEDSIDGQYWKKEWKNGEGRKIPIFYTEKNNAISAIGLTQIFKLAYKRSLKEAINQTVDKNKLDLSETIFGTSTDECHLKGRVKFSHLKSTHVSYEKEKSEILGSPQPTYYPNYIRQTDIKTNGINKYTTLMDNGAEISGYKRYPLHNSIKSSFKPDEEKTDIQTKFKPLSKGSIFKGKLRFHNLKKIEIGALLSALTFHGSSNYRHNLGMAKSLGYGKIKINSTLKNLKFKQEDYLKEYETEMTIFMDLWTESIQLKELFSMSNNKIISDKNLVYQKLENPHTNEKEKNDFMRDKKNKKYLKNHSEMDIVNSISIESHIDTMQLKIEKEMRIAIEAEQKSLETALNSDNTQVIKNFIDNNKDNKSISILEDKLKKLEEAIQEDKFKEINEQAEKALSSALSQKDKNTRKKYLQSYIKKWENQKNNKDSKFVLELVEKAKKEIN